MNKDYCRTMSIGESIAIVRQMYDYAQYMIAETVGKQDWQAYNRWSRIRDEAAKKLCEIDTDKLNKEYEKAKESLQMS